MKAKRVTRRKYEKRPREALVSATRIPGLYKAPPPFLFCLSTDFMVSPILRILNIHWKRVIELLEFRRIENIVPRRERNVSLFKFYF